MQPDNNVRAVVGPNNRKQCGNLKQRIVTGTKLITIAEVYV